MSPTLSIIIVSYNARADLVRCLESLHDAPPAVSHDIIVVDNRSTDGSAAAVRRWPSVTLVDAGANVGFARANNLGIRATTGAYVLLLNGDTLVPPGAIDRLVSALDARPDAAVAGPRLVDGVGRAEVSFGRMIGPFSEFRQKLLRGGHARGVPGVAALVERMTRRPATPDWVSGACLLVRREVAEEAGLLDERYFMYTEDVDFCAAIRALGHRIIFVPESEVVHLRGRSAATAVGATRAAYRRSQLAFYEKHRPRWVPLLRLYLRLRGQI